MGDVYVAREYVNVLQQYVNVSMKYVNVSSKSGSRGLHRRFFQHAG
jgi:septum formation topological specificity factor MinE